MQATQLADATEVFGSAELSLEPKPAMPLRVVQPNDAARTAGPAVTPSDILALAMQAGDKDVERLSRLMDMEIRYREQRAVELRQQREWDEQDRIRDALLAHRENFAEFRGENIVIPLTKHVDRAAAGSFDQAEYHRVAGMLSPALSKHGYGFRHDVKFGSSKWVNADGVESMVPWVTVTCFLEHRKGHVESLMLEGPPGELKGNTIVQNMQATASFFKRQSLLAITGTSTGGEDDENKIGKREEGASSAPADANVGHLIELRNTGELTARAGMQALTAWWAKLTPRDQKDMSPHFSALRKAARAVDEGGAQ